MKQYYYIDKNGQQQGPIMASKLPKYGVTRKSKVWTQGMLNWQTAGSIPELSSIFPPVITLPSYMEEEDDDDDDEIDDVDDTKGKGHDHSTNTNEIFGIVWRIIATIVLVVVGICIIVALVSGDVSPSIPIIAGLVFGVGGGLAAIWKDA